MLYQTAQILGSYYFEKKRGIVNGLITSGTGLGLLIFFPLSALLIEKFALSGTYYIWQELLFKALLAVLPSSHHTEQFA